eukprot:SAG31_NODE_3476_length_4230_cov_3.514645_5_plen_280_part_00
MQVKFNTVGYIASLFKNQYECSNAARLSDMLRRYGYAIRYPPRRRRRGARARIALGRTRGAAAAAYLGTVGGPAGDTGRGAISPEHNTLPITTPVPRPQHAPRPRDALLPCEMAMRARPLLRGAAAQAQRGQQLCRMLSKGQMHRRTIAHGSADLNWDTMLFDYVPTKSHIEYTWKDGEWDGGVMKSSPFVEVHIMSNVMHYGQSLFEGLKAFSCADGEVRVFQPYDGNSQRMNAGCDRLHMPNVPAAMFNDAIDKVVCDNLDYVPPYGTGLSPHPPSP